MKYLLAGITALSLGLATSSEVSAQGHNRNVIRDSANGIGNLIQVRNGGIGFHGGVNRNIISNSANGIGNSVQIRNGGGFGTPFPQSFAPVFSGGSLYPQYNGGFPGLGGGVNVNVITNSGNGQGNTISTNNRGNSWLNINVITNSGNGIGNVIGVRNR